MAHAQIRLKFAASGVDSTAPTPPSVYLTCDAPRNGGPLDRE
jgi:hypothetical protein